MGDKQATKVSRMRQHLSAAKPAPCGTKPRVTSHAQTANAAESDLEILKQQVPDISAQLGSIKIESSKQKHA